MKESYYLARQLLLSIGFDLNDKNYSRTPERFVDFLEQFTLCLNDKNGQQIDDILDVRFPKHSDLMSPYKGMIIQSPIKVYSLCSHHLLPIIYTISIAYIPSENRQIGFSKLTRAIRLIASRPMNQEDFTQFLVERLRAKLEPEGMAVIVKGIHMCMSMRGAMVDTNNINSAVRGSFKDNLSTKEEFMRMGLNL